MLIDRKFSAASQYVWAQNDRDRRKARNHIKKLLGQITSSPIWTDGETLRCVYDCGAVKADQAVADAFDKACKAMADAGHDWTTV